MARQRYYVRERTVETCPCCGNVRVAERDVPVSKEKFEQVERDWFAHPVGSLAIESSPDGKGLVWVRG